MKNQICYCFERINWMQCTGTGTNFSGKFCNLKYNNQTIHVNNTQPLCLNSKQSLKLSYDANYSKNMWHYLAPTHQQLSTFSNVNESHFLSLTKIQEIPQPFLVYCQHITILNRYTAIKLTLPKYVTTFALKFCLATFRSYINKHNQKNRRFIST